MKKKKKYCEVCGKYLKPEWKKLTCSSKCDENQTNYEMNKEKVRVYQKALRESPKVKAYCLKRYNLNVKDYLKMIKKQNNKCAICGNCETTKIGKSSEGNEGEIKALGVDHNHKTGGVRGLLCFKCNLGLGNANEDIFILKNCIKYLEEWKLKHKLLK